MTRSNIIKKEEEEIGVTGVLTDTADDAVRAMFVCASTFDAHHTAQCSATLRYFATLNVLLREGVTI